MLVFWLSSVFLAFAQPNIHFTSKSKEAKIPFDWTSNQIIIPVQINGVAMNFLIDTGVSHCLIFDSHKAKQLGFSKDHPIYLRGLGDQPALKAYRVTITSFALEELEFKFLEALVLPENEFVISRRLGTQVDGIIGYDFFAQYPVLIDYQRRFMVVNPQKLHNRWKKTKVIHSPLTFHARKPYIELEVDHLKSGKYLIDSGLSDALWLFSFDNKTPMHYPVFSDFLGTGINGDVYGYRGKLPLFNLKDLKINDVKVAYPEVDSIQKTQIFQERMGSIGAELLSRFKVLIDYPEKQISLYPTRRIQKPFYYNLSGLEFEYDGLQLIKKRVAPVQRNNENGQNRGIEILLRDRFEIQFHPTLTVTYVRPNSPADKSGIKIGDVMTEINGRKVYQMDLEKVHSLLQKEPGDIIRLLINREGEKMRFSFELQSIFETIKPSLLSLEKQ